MITIHFTDKEEALFRLATDPAATAGEASAAAQALGKILRKRGAPLEEMVVESQQTPRPARGWTADSMDGGPQPQPTPQPLWTKIMLGHFWVEETPKKMVMRDFFQYFKDRNISPGDAMGLAAWWSGMIAGLIIHGDGEPDTDAQREHMATQYLHDHVAQGLAQAHQAQARR
jgi:hypothetical protein